MTISTSFLRFPRFSGLLHLLKTLRGKMTKTFLYLCVLCVVQEGGVNMFGYKGLSRTPINANVISFGQGKGACFKITQTDSSSCSSTGKETEQRSSIPVSMVYISDRYSIQMFTIFNLPAGDRPAAYHFPPKLSQKNACSSFSG